MLLPQTTPKNRTILVCSGCYNEYQTGGLNNMNLFLRVLEAGKFEINMPADLGLGLQYMNLQGSHSVHSNKE